MFLIHFQITEQEGKEQAHSRK